MLRLVVWLIAGVALIAGLSGCREQTSQGTKTSQDTATTQQDQMPSTPQQPPATTDWSTISWPDVDPAIPEEVQTQLPRPALSVLAQMPVAAILDLDQAGARSLLKEHGIVPEPTKLNEAANYGQTRLVAIMLRAGLNPNAIDMQGLTTLAAACAGGHLPCAQLVLAAGGQLTSPLGRTGRSAIHLAAMGGHLAVVEWLIDHGVDIDSLDHEGNTPLMLASTNSLDMTQWLVQHGADLKAVNYQQMTVLHFAMRDDSLEVIKWLVEQQHFDIETKDSQKELSAIGFAVLFGNLEAVKYLLQRQAAVDGVDRRGYGLYHNAVLSGNPQLIETLHDSGLDLEHRSVYEGWTPLMYATFLGNQYIVEALLKLGADVQARDNGGLNALELNAAQPAGDNRQAVDELLRQAMGGSNPGSSAS